MMATEGRKRVEVPGKGPGGIVCRRCGCADMRTRNTIRLDGEVRRYKVCRACGRTVRTTER